MRRKIHMLAFLLLLLHGCACAEAYTGVATVLSEVAVCAEADGVLESVAAWEGAVIGAGDTLASYRAQKHFATQDGTVARLCAQEGKPCDGTVLELLPMEKYQVVCTAKNAYSSAETMLLHAGEQVWIKCVRDGTHRGIGIVTAISGEEYTVLTVGGEFHTGETVYLYRDEAFSAKLRVGIGTVIESAVEPYEADGTLAALYVEKGEEVERGQLLYETLPAQEKDIASDVAGIVYSVNVSVGESVRKGQVIATVVPRENIRVQITADEKAMASFPVGAMVRMTCAADRDETVFSGTVESIFDTEDAGVYRVVIAPEATDALLPGMTVTVRGD